MLPIHDVAERINKRLVRLPLGKPSFADPRYKAYDFDLKNFHPIRSDKANPVMSFLDGGNAPVVIAPNFAVYLTRVYFNLFKGTERIFPKNLPPLIEFYTICYAVDNGGRIFYETEFVPLKEKFAVFLPDDNDLSFDSFDPTLRIGPQRVPIDRVAKTARLFAEWRYSRFVIEKELEVGDMMIQDGTLQTIVTNERKYADETNNVALEKEVKLLGLSKTSTLFTTTGYSLFAAIAELAESSPLTDSSWFYHPIVDINQPDHRAEMYAVKLHPQSHYVFRLELLKPQVKGMEVNEIGEVISQLSLNSHDASFPGYPYGLLDADKFARVRYDEKEDRRIQFLSFASGNGLLVRLNRCLNSSNAHDVLNRLLRG